MRQASAPAAQAGARQTHVLHQAGDIMRQVNGFAFLSCTCGLKLKIPPNFKAGKVQCPRCKQSLDVPK